MSVHRERSQKDPDHALVAALFLLAGMYALLLFSRLPAMPVLLPACLALAVLAAACRRRSFAFLPLGLALIAVDAGIVNEQKLDARLAGKDIELVARIADFPVPRATGLRMRVAPIAGSGLPPNVRLSWVNDTAAPQIGECWRLTVRLRRPRGFANPGGFDYEGWLFRQRIGATGYVREGEQLDDCPGRSALQRLRGSIAKRMTELLPADRATAVILAITVGARHNISPDQWERYALTGTSHLMAISGMHVGLAAAACYLLTWLILGSLRRHGNHRVLAAIVALVAAGAYASLSGFAVPARRAFIMLALVTIAIVARRKVSPGHFLATALLVIACTSPLDVLSPGFQLSFAAVAVLVLLALRRTAPAAPAWWGRGVGAVRVLLAVQLALLLGLFPLTALVFGRAAWLAPGVNLAVLPLFNLVSVPAALAGLVFGGPFALLGDGLLWMAWHSVALILTGIELAAGIPAAAQSLPALGVTGTALACLSLLWILLPPGWPARRFAWIAFAATLMHVPERPPEACVDIHTLDVGQGLATVLVTTRRVLVFDTGPRFRSGTDTAQLVVTPFLRSLGVDSVDLLIVSHADLDHAGGLRSLRRQWPVDSVIAGEPETAGNNALACLAGQAWSWDGIAMRILHPPRPDLAGNNASCVLEVSAGSVRALLTGDIEAGVERRLLRDGLLSTAELVLMPHHGSLTSSSPRFVSALSPAAVVASAGFENRWRMPRDEVVARWRAAGADVYSTAQDGAVSFRLCADSGAELTNRARHARRKVWRE